MKSGINYENIPNHLANIEHRVRLIFHPAAVMMYTL